MQFASATPEKRKFYPPDGDTAVTDPAPPMASLLAGARARGVADGFQWLGLAAILINDRGEAMHINAGAAALMENIIYLEDGCLRAHDPDADYALDQAVRAALAEGAPRSVDFGRAAEIVAHIAAMPADPDDPYQLLRAVVLLRGRA